MDKYTIENDRKDSLITLAWALTVFPWLVMLAVGALGHRLELPYLFKFGFFEVLLVNVAAFPFRNPGFVKKVVKRV